jgi:hypothetical protein
MPGMFDFLAPEMRLLEKWKKKSLLVTLARTLM